jgi:cytochrome b561
MTSRHPVRSRVLHWLTAALVVPGLLIGFAMVNSFGSYAALLAVHMTIGVTVLLVTTVRIVNRFTVDALAWPSTVGRVEGLIITNSGRLMYLLLLAQPLIGWAMESATGRPPLIFGSVRLPRIAPFSDELFFVLRQTHSVIAYLLVIAIAAHVSGVLLHVVALRDGILSRMAFSFGREPSSEATHSVRSDIA